MSEQVVKRPGGGAMSDTPQKPGDVRQGNTPTNAGSYDINEAPHRHTASGKVVVTSENFPVREHAKQAGENTPGGKGQFETWNPPESGTYIQRPPIQGRTQEVPDAKPREKAAIQAEKQQRRTGKQLQNPDDKMSNPRNSR